MVTLRQCEPALPAGDYYDPAHYQREIERIWWTEWLCLGRVDDVQAAGDFRLFAIGEQRIFVTRDGDGVLHAFHDTCRHRGSSLCDAPVGRFRQRRIVCPYHAWTYSLSGELLATPKRLAAEDFDRSNYNLYRVALDSWAGFLFVNLAAKPGLSLHEALGDEPQAVANWPLARLQTAHRETHAVQCNWKVFWENFNECYHCPQVHPELCRLVPMYGRAVASAEDDPAAAEAAHSRSVLAPGAVTWSMDGRTEVDSLEGLNAQDRAAGMTFATFLPGMFITAHIDYVRTVRVLPLGPERTELTVDWLLAPEAASRPGFDLERVVEFGRLIVLQDARICEVNQRGLRSRAHAAGVLMPQEHGVYEFQRWVRARLADA